MALEHVLVRIRTKGGWRKIWLSPESAKNPDIMAQLKKSFGALEVVVNDHPVEKYFRYEYEGEGP